MLMRSRGTSSWACHGPPKPRWMLKVVAVVDGGPEQMIVGGGAWLGSPPPRANLRVVRGGETQRRGQRASKIQRPFTHQDKVVQARRKSTVDRIEQQWLVDVELPPDGVVSGGKPVSAQRGGAACADAAPQAARP